ncbi:hypothetical protein K8I28_06030 [bacterium]|nr:hypothetical protein [bacterium]
MSKKVPNSQVKDLELEPDSRFSGYRSRKDFEAYLGPMYLRSEVPVSIANKLKILQRLLIHSYYEYEFFDIALLRALQIFEMALKVRYAEIECGDSDRTVLRKIKNKLYKLIDWADDMALLENPVEVTHRMREFRNYIMHGDPESLMGITSLQAVYTVVDFINDLYEDTEVRKVRHKKESDLRKVLEPVITGGGILTIGETRLIVHLAEVLTCIDVGKRFEYYVGIAPIFDPKEKDGSLSIPDPIPVRFDIYEYSDKRLEMFLKKKCVSELESINDTVNKNRYEEFIRGYESNEMLEFMIRNHLNDMRLGIKRTSSFVTGL